MTDDPGDVGEQEAVAFRVLRFTGLPINPDQYVEVAAEVVQGRRACIFGVCISTDESKAARLKPSPATRLEYAEFRWWSLQAALDLNLGRTT